MNIKNFTFRHVEKFVLGITAGYLVYALLHIFIVLHLRAHETDTKLASLSNVIERKLKTSVPPALNKEREEAAQLESRFTTPPPATRLLHSHLFVKFTKGETISGITTKDLFKKPELQTLPYSACPTPGSIEFTLKGGTADLALIQVRKLHKDSWLTESFIVEGGKTIGGKKIIAREPVDFNTYCKLIKIIPSAQKALIFKKSALLRNEKGEFIGTSLAEEKHMISTSKIVFKDKKGESYDLWIGELANLGTETVTIYSSVNTASTN
ncbi:MAG: hypothetical protein DYG83_02965 [Candidatus Brocadia sp. AMX2]|uniref:Uncharacterized protein n=1 Tax=Candidatus Brocadia sinica JPN1 TaxID=1197129 RepID=A0ABQ0JWQ6_9BACT|nr:MULTISPECIES: hypothetical protein [Brocadia]KXK29553.1 MAG: hypothetical protein UZ01_01928 [Candidatus Brocadia sinica]MBC6931112.1 hypothetical protein [Candidatus Brocadia sp.]MBL1167489.1 hypothetical protein [Candidatus Brocadia sp. AMX1]NOG41039.1 hypothetical protein [Planctomycetota bacterium]KAA0244642.1 MAG: hypothetical protein EDM70_05440 [Candidatus Brocadia sp. AMX2]